MTIGECVRVRVRVRVSVSVRYIILFFNPNYYPSGKFYIVTDGPAQNFWKVLDVAITAMGFQSVLSKFHLPVFLLMGLGYLCDIFSRLSGKKLKLSVFNVKMLTIHRNFSIVNATEDLKYSPLVSFEEGWASTIDWYVENWLPTWNK